MVTELPPEYHRKGERDAQRQTLLQKLRRKMGIDKVPEDPDQEEPDATQMHPKAYMRNNKVVVRKTRKVELYLYMRESSNARKMEEEQGELIFLKMQKKADVLSVAKELFFTNGSSKKGKLEDFSFDILDYQEDAVLDADITVGELYSLLKMGMLRFYLCTKERKQSTITEIINIPDEDVENNEPEDEKSFSYSSDSSEVMIGPYTSEPLAW